MLEALTAERERHDRHRNLVVAATGTGKTVVAALGLCTDCRASGWPAVAAVYRAPPRDPQSGDRSFPNGPSRRLLRRDPRLRRIRSRPSRFAMVQSLRDPEAMEPTAFDMAIATQQNTSGALGDHRIRPRSSGRSVVTGSRRAGRGQRAM